MSERWKRIPFSSGYEISNMGRVRSTKRNKITILKPEEVGRPDRKKTYLRVTLSSGKRKKHRKIHRLVALAFKKRIPGKNTVNHINGNTHDNREVNLEWTTNEENIKHAWDTGLMAYERTKTRGVRQKQKRGAGRARRRGK